MKARSGCEKPVPIATENTTQDSKTEYRIQIVWRNTILLSLLHIIALYGTYHAFAAKKLATTMLGLCYAIACTFGLAAGAHRLWTHRSYKAIWQFRLLLALLQAGTFQNDILEWSRDHRGHHKFSETDADPHNSLRGFFFSHVGWLMVKKHPDVIKKGKTVDLSDLLADPIVMWQHKYYYVVMPIMAFILPTWMTWYFLNEGFWTSFLLSGITRYVYNLNLTWLINSAAHTWGYRPYDKNVGGVESTMVAVLTFGEGWHNYHHVFPWDSRTSEFGKNLYNPTSEVLQMFAKIGWVYDMKEVNPEMVKRRALRTGDGTYRDNNAAEDDDKGIQDHKDPDQNLWGWGDRDMTARDKEFILITKQLNAM